MLAFNPLPHHQRRPGPCEQVFLCRAVERYYHNFHISARYNRHVTKEALSAALRQVILKRLFLAVNFFRDDGHSWREDTKTSGKYFMIKPLASIDFDTVVEYHKWDGPVSDAFYEHLDTILIPADDNCPTWKLLVYDMAGAQLLVFLNNHSLLDGKSGAFFHDDLVSELAKLGPDPAFRQTLFSYEKDCLQLASLVPSCEKINRLRHATWPFFFSTVISTFLPQFVKTFVNSMRPCMPNLYKHPFFRFKPSVAEVETRFKLVHFSPSETKLLVEYTRRNGYTLTPLLGAVAVSVVQQDVYPLVDTKTVFSSVVNIILEGRRYFPGQKEDLKYGLHMAVNAHAVKPMTGSKEEILATAVKMSANMNRALEARTNFLLVGMLKYINTWTFNRDAVDRIDGRPILEISNIGNQTIEHGLWKVVDLYFGQSVSCFDHIGTSFVSTAEGGMNMCIQYAPEYAALVGRNGKRAMANVADDFKKTILDIARDGN